MHTFSFSLILLKVKLNKPLWHFWYNSMEWVPRTTCVYMNRFWMRSPRQIKSVRTDTVEGTVVIFKFYEDSGKNKSSFSSVV